MLSTKQLIRKGLAKQALYGFASKELSFSSEARDKMLKGCEELADAVQITLGPSGRNVLIDQQFGGVKITKDGVTVAKAIEFSDRFKNMGASLVKGVASKANDEAGDGTTTATILARSIFKEGLKSMESGVNSANLRKGIQKAVDAIVAELKKMSVPVNSRQQIQAVASISANGDKNIGKLLAELFEKVGHQGSITIGQSKTLKHEIEFVEGMRFDRGYISPYFLTDQKTQKVAFEKPLILIAEGKITSFQQILKYVEHALEKKQPLLIIADDVESEPLANLIVNKVKAGIKVCAVKAPSYGDNRKALLNDIAILTGATVISDEIGVTFDNAGIDVLGNAGKVEVSKEDTIVMNGNGDKAALKERLDQIKAQIKITTSSYDKEKLEERLAKLTGGVGVIKVGGGSDVEVGEVKDRIEDALNATKAAIEEGIVVGGGCALIYAAKVLDTLKGDNDCENTGINIIKKAISLPCAIIAKNAGFESFSVVEKIKASKDNTYGFDAYKGTFVNMIEKGIIDPTKVVRIALVDASSVAALMTSTECMIVDAKEDKKESAGGMGGMGGMDY